MAAAEAVAQHFRANPDLFGHAGYVAGYWAMGGELPLHVLQMRLFPGQVWCLPLVGDETPGPMAFAPWRPGDPLVTNRYGIPEPDVSPTSLLGPSDLRIVLAPLVAFDERGNRIGMGAGFYDRSFVARGPGAAPQPPLLVGVGYEFQRLTAIEPQPWDVPLDAVLTERGLQRFSR